MYLHTCIYASNISLFHSHVLCRSAKIWVSHGVLREPRLIHHHETCMWRKGRNKKHAMVSLNAQCESNSVFGHHEWLPKSQAMGQNACIMASCLTYDLHATSQTCMYACKLMVRNMYETMYYSAMCMLAMHIWHSPEMFLNICMHIYVSVPVCVDACSVWCGRALAPASGKVPVFHFFVVDIEPIGSHNIKCAKRICHTFWMHMLASWCFFPIVAAAVLVAILFEDLLCRSRSC